MEIKQECENQRAMEIKQECENQRAMEIKQDLQAKSYTFTDGVYKHSN